MREKAVIFGVNFPLATRIADLVRREFEVISYQFSAKKESGRTEVSNNFSGELLSDIVLSHGAHCVIFTSESLLHIYSDSVFFGLINELSRCKQLSNIHLVYIEIADPVVTDQGSSIQVLQANSSYHERARLFCQRMEGIFDSRLQVQSIYSPEDDIWSINFLHLLFMVRHDELLQVTDSVGDWGVLGADEVAQAVLVRWRKIGTERLAQTPYPGGLRGFCKNVREEHKKWLNSRITPVDQKNQSLMLCRKKERREYFDFLKINSQTHCAVNYLYRKLPEESFGLETIGHLRKELGKNLAQFVDKQIIDTVDFVIPVPQTGRMYAIGLAEALDIPYLEAIYKSDRKRSFDIESFDVRREFLYSRLSVVPGVLSGKVVLVVDEAIFTGATLKVVSHLLRHEGVKSIYFAIPSPEARYSCEFNMQPKRDLLSQYMRKEDYWSYFNVQGVFFQGEDVFLDSIEKNGPQCVDCFIKR